MFTQSVVQTSPRHYNVGPTRIPGFRLMAQVAQNKSNGLLVHEFQ